jgi:hypothetical protein
MNDRAGMRLHPDALPGRLATPLAHIAGRRKLTVLSQH